jgi:hypothetical protein
MSVPGQQAEWYYVGQYGELGPLTLDQMKDLIQDKVIAADTFVWRTGMTDWVQASTVSELRSRISAGMTTPPPPPPPMGSRQSPQQPAPSPYQSLPPQSSFQPNYHPQQSMNWTAMEASLPKSDKSRVTAGLLCLIPGVGRLYLGYGAHGALQIISFLFCGVGLLWSWIDCFYILLGGVKYDGYGRVLSD